MKILYVEDDELLREDIAELAGGPGREIVDVGSAEEALGRLADETFDVIVTDINLPGASGLDLARQVLADRPQQWIIVCTGFATPPQLVSLGPNVRAISKDEVDTLLQRLLANAEASLARR